MTEDPYLWLEDVTGDEALAWVRDRNDATTAVLATTERFAELRDRNREVLDADDRIPYVTRRGRWLYNLWQDAANPRGLWRRTTLDSYRTEKPDWQVVLDLDALSEQEGENWVWKGATTLRPEHRHAMVMLSRGGADAVVAREFDLEACAFVEDGFTVPEAKSRVRWLDADTLFVGTDTGEGSMTTSGYPRTARQWRRGTRIEDAPVVFEGKPADVSVYAYRDHTPGFERTIVGRNPTFYSSEEFLLGDDGALTRIDVPDDANTTLHEDWLLITTRTPWRVGEREYPGGALLASRLDAFLAGARDLDVLYEPDGHGSLYEFAWTKNHVLLSTLHDVAARLEVLTPGPDGWSRAPLAGAPEFGVVDIIDTDPDTGDEYFLGASSFVQPATLTYGVVGEGVEQLKQAPALFDAEGVRVEQRFATSADGTRVPYFLIGKNLDEPGPTLLNGYGGFEISMTPSYSAIVGRGWLTRGGTYAIANIRGGGEYGPAWHQAALRENRHRAYEDFAAVATDLVDKGVTTPERLGAIGGSNGGLLMGVMLTRYPKLFGAIVCQVPLLDMRRYHKLLAGASWMAEWGDPDDENDWAYLQTYSPYHLFRADGDYPPVLFVTSTRDDRVHPGHARKMAARMLAAGKDVGYYENIEGGHGAAADNEQIAFRWALAYEFLWERLTGR